MLELLDEDKKQKSTDSAMSLTFDISYEEFYCDIAHIINKKQPLYIYV